MKRKYTGYPGDGITAVFAKESSYVRTQGVAQTVESFEIKAQFYETIKSLGQRSAYSSYFT